MPAITPDATTRPKAHGPRSVAAPRGHLALLATLAAARGLACLPAVRPDGGRGLLAPGAAAPPLSGRNGRGAPTSLEAQRGRFAVVTFHSEDDAPICTRQVLSFRDNLDRFRTLGVEIFAVSTDDEETHARFRVRHRLPFVLVADPAGEARRAFGVSSVFGMAARVTFLVDPDGRVARVWPDADPATAATDVLADLVARGGRGPERGSVRSLASRDREPPEVAAQPRAPL